MGDPKMSRKFNAMLGLGALAAFGFASSAFAQCPSSPVPPWSGVSSLLGGVAIQAGGYDGTSCKLAARLTGAAGSATAFVRDDTPADEPSYRAQFLLNADNLTGQNALQIVRVFYASTDNAPAGGSPGLIQMSIAGGSNKVLNVATACTENTSQICVGAVPLTGGTAGTHRVELAWTKGSPGQLRVWVNNTTEASPNLTISATNAAWGGVDTAALGLASATSAFRSAQLNRDVYFDEFDSRRTTFIGN
jgi:hypothetical protein